LQRAREREEKSRNNLRDRVGIGRRVKIPKRKKCLCTRLIKQGHRHFWTGIREKVQVSLYRMPRINTIRKRTGRIQVR
jgi:hypothetical protein